MTLVGSTFSGIEGMGLAATRAGMNLAWSCEIDPDARAVIESRFPDVKLHGDIAEIGYGPHVSTSVEPVDLLCGGFPCQDLSVAGRRAGLAGARSGLFFEFARLADEIAPTWIVLENVPGLLSSNDGRDMGTVVGTLADLGYGVAYRVLDAQNFGVPQRRRRVVIVGHLGNVARAGEILFEPEGSGRDSASSGGEAESSAVGTLGGSTPSSGWRLGADEAAAGQLIPSLAPLSTSERGTLNDPTQATFLPLGFSHTQGLDVQASESAWPTLRAEGGGAAIAFAQNQRGELVESPAVQALSTGGGKPGAGYPAIRQEVGVRRLTPTECERLQGFPDGWTDVPNARGKPMPDSARYRMLGNAVAVPVFEWAFSRIERAS